MGELEAMMDRIFTNLGKISRDKNDLIVPVSFFYLFLHLGKFSEEIPVKQNYPFLPQEQSTGI
jgi:hypothetical protein